MTVAGRPGVALAEPEMAGEAFALFVVDKVQVHAMGIILATGKTEILLQLEIFGAVSAISRCLLHGVILVEVALQIKISGQPTPQLPGQRSSRCNAESSAPRMI